MAPPYTVATTDQGISDILRTSRTSAEKQLGLTEGARGGEALDPRNVVIHSGFALLADTGGGAVGGVDVVADLKVGLRHDDED